LLMKTPQSPTSSWKGETRILLFFQDKGNENPNFSRSHLRRSWNSCILRSVCAPEGAFFRRSQSSRVLFSIVPLQDIDWFRFKKEESDFLASFSGISETDPESLCFPVCVFGARDTFQSRCTTIMHFFGTCNFCELLDTCMFFPCVPMSWRLCLV